MVIRTNLSQRNGTCVRTNNNNNNHKSPTSSPNGKVIKTKLNATTTTTTTTTTSAVGGDDPNNLSSMTGNDNSHNPSSKRFYVYKRPSFVQSGICFIISYYIWTLLLSISGELSKLSITVTDVTHIYKTESKDTNPLLEVKSKPLVQYEEAGGNNNKESNIPNSIQRKDEDIEEEDDKEEDGEEDNSKDDENEDDEDENADKNNNHISESVGEQKDTNESNSVTTTTTITTNNDADPTKSASSKPLILISSTISDQISNRIRNNNNNISSMEFKYNISNEIHHERWERGECTAESLRNGGGVQYVARPYAQNRTLAVLLYTITPINNNRYQQKIIQSFIDSVVLPNNKETTDIAIIYYHSDVPTKQNLQSVNAFFMDFFQGYNLKYIWPINVTKYKQNDDWGLAIEDIIQNELYNMKHVNTSTSVLSKIDTGRWRDMILRNVRPFNDEYTITGGIRPCYFIMTRYTANRACSGIHGVSSLLLYYQLQQHLLYGSIPTAEKKVFPTAVSPIDLYDRFILTHSNMYHVCEHPNIITALDPNFIWTPSAVDNDKEITDSADQLGIPITHWIVSYQHITHGLLNFVPNLFSNFQYYKDHENVADHTVQRLVRSVWQYQCLLPYHRRFHRTMISAAYTSYKSTPTSLNNVVHEIDDIRWKYPNEYEATRAICNAKILDTLDSFIVSNAKGSVSSANQRSMLSSTIPDPNAGAKFALPTAAVDNTSYIYPVVCPNAKDDNNSNSDEESNVLPLDETYANDESHNKTLVIIIGSLRGGEIAWNTLYKNVLDYNHADLALLIGDTRDAYENATMFHRAKFYWKFKEYNDWATPIDSMIMKDLVQETTNSNNNNETIIEDWRSSILPHIDRDEGVFGGITGYKGSGAIIMIIRYFLQKKIQELNLLQKYERFVVTRADHYYLCTHDLSKLSLDYIWTPDGGSDFWGVTDRHLVVSNKYILQALDILPVIFRYPKSFISLNLDMMNPERLIRYSWHLQCLLDKHKQFPRVMFTCGVKGDKTRWEKLKKMVIPEGVQLKYSNEYYASQLTCKNQESL